MFAKAPKLSEAASPRAGGRGVLEPQSEPLAWLPAALGHSSTPNADQPQEVELGVRRLYNMGEEEARECPQNALMEAVSGEASRPWQYRCVV